MLQPSDSLATYLKTMGYSGSVNDMLYAYLISINGLIFGSISLNDLIHRTLVGWGYTGTLSDMIASFMTATAGGGLANYPRSLFAANEQGIWLDPSDFSTLFQDASGTTPVTAVGQPVGLIRDKSGRGNHATQATAASRPTLQQDSNGLYYLSFDGTDDGMLTPSIDFTGTNKMTVWAGVRKLSDVASATIVELSSDASAIDGTFLLRGPTGAASNYALYAKGTAGALAGPTPSPFAAPITNVLVLHVDTSLAVANKIYGRVNGTTYTNATDMGTGNFGNYPLYVGRRNNAERPFNGRIYQLIVRGAASNAGQIAATEAYVNAKTRAY